MLENTFLNGLKPVVKAVVVRRRPTGLEEIMTEAQLNEDRDIAIQMVIKAMGQGSVIEALKLGLTNVGKGGNTQGTNTSTKAIDVGPLHTITLPEKGAVARKKFAARRIFYIEFQAKREKGLCFCCDEKYTTNHRCKKKETKELRVLLVNGTEKIEVLQAHSTEDEEKIDIPDVGDFVEPDLKSVIGFSTLETMKVKGLLKGKVVVVQIDCGAIHNFISQKLVEQLKLPVVETSHYGIVMGNGVATKGKGVYKALSITFPKLTIEKDFLSLELGGVGIILGMPLLRTMGTMGVDWAALIMTFKAGDRKVTIKGDPSLTKAKASLKMLAKTWQEANQGFLVELRDLSLDGSNK